MNTLYKRQFALMAGVLLVAFALLGSAFAALSYQYIIQDKRETLERNASYVAAFTSSYLSSAGGAGIQEPAYQLYISSLANISGSTVILAENDGEIVYASSGRSHGPNSLLSGTVPGEVMDLISQDGKFAGLSSLGGLLSDKCYVSAVPILQSSYITGLTYRRGVVLVASDTTVLAGMWQDLAIIFLLSAAVVLLLAAAASSVTSLWQTKPLKDMADTVRRFGRGELEARVEGYEERKDEVGELAGAFNTMADSLDRKSVV